MDDFSISGWKRYPIHGGNRVVKTTDTDNKNIGTKFTPLKDGVVFKGKLRYHNLKKSELGAILSALTFHNTPNTFHNIGMAKSLGYGKVEVKLDGIDNMQSYLKAFELITTQTILNFKESEQLKELITMATEQNNSGNSKLKYMELKEFGDNKTGTKHYLKNYTKLNDIKSISIKSLVSQSDLDELKVLHELYLKEQKELEVKRAKKQKFQDELSTLDYENIQILENFIAKYPEYEKLDEIKAKKDALVATQNSNKHAKVDENAKNAYEALEKKKGKPKEYDKLKTKFIKKWNDSKNNKGSEFTFAVVNLYSIIAYIKILKR